MVRRDLKRVAMAINFISSKDSDETRTMHTKSNNVEIMMGIERDEIIEEKYQEGLEESMRGMNLPMIVLMYCIIILKK